MGIKLAVVDSQNANSHQQELTARKAGEMGKGMWAGMGMGISSKRQDVKSS